MERKALYDFKCLVDSLLQQQPFFENFLNEIQDERFSDAQFRKNSLDHFFQNCPRYPTGLLLTSQIGYIAVDSKCYDNLIQLQEYTENVINLITTVFHTAIMFCYLDPETCPEGQYETPLQNILGCLQIQLEELLSSYDDLQENFNEAKNKLEKAYRGLPFSHSWDDEKMGEAMSMHYYLMEQMTLEKSLEENKSKASGTPHGRYDYDDVMKQIQFLLEHAANKIPAYKGKNIVNFLSRRLKDFTTGKEVSGFTVKFICKYKNRDDNFMKFILDDDGLSINYDCTLQNPETQTDEHRKCLWFSEKYCLIPPPEEFTEQLVQQFAKCKPVAEIILHDTKYACKPNSEQ